MKERKHCNSEIARLEDKVDGADMSDWCVDGFLCYI